MKSKGFTLIELFVVITIIGILSSTLFLGTTQSQRALALQRSAFQLAQDLREIQEKAMGAGESSCGTHNFGVYFKQGTDRNSYLLFADCNNNCVFNSPESDEVIKEVQLEKGVSYTRSSKLNIVFSPPDPKVFINSNDCLISWAQEATITLDFEGGISKSVKINSAGRIEIE